MSDREAAEAKCDYCNGKGRAFEAFTMEDEVGLRCDGTGKAQVATDPRDEVLRLAREALEFYANPETYRAHPHGLAFDDRDKSWTAKSALAAINQALATIPAQTLSDLAAIDTGNLDARPAGPGVTLSTSTDKGE